MKSWKKVITQDYRQQVHGGLPDFAGDVENGSRRILIFHVGTDLSDRGKLTIDQFAISCTYYTTRQPIAVPARKDFTVPLDCGTRYSLFSSVTVFSGGEIE